MHREHDPMLAKFIWFVSLILLLEIQLNNCSSPNSARSTSTQQTSGATISNATPTTSDANNSQNQNCGYNNTGHIQAISTEISLCIPPMICTYENCPPTLGVCQNNTCMYATGYQGLATIPQAWATYYCQLSSGTCQGITQNATPAQTADKLAQIFRTSLCETADANTTCVGIAASSPLLIGNSQIAIDPSTSQIVSHWGLGLSEAANLCYRITGPHGQAIVALTDRCGGYCSCNTEVQECGACLNSNTMKPNCPCVGTAPPLYESCCGSACSSVNNQCDWCASNNHPHFDLDTGTFAHVCGPTTSVGSCQLTHIEPLACNLNVSWPP